MRKNLRSLFIMIAAVLVWLFATVIYPLTFFFWSIRLFTEKISGSTHRLNKYYVCSFYGESVVLDNKAKWFLFCCEPEEYWNSRTGAIKKVKDKFPNQSINTTTITLVYKLEKEGYTGEIVPKKWTDEFDAYMVTLCNLRNLKNPKKLFRQFDRIAKGDKKKFIFK